MAVTEVNLSHHLGSSIDYCVKGKAHNDDMYVQGRRALKVGAINGSANPEAFKKENRLMLKDNPYVNKNSVKSIHTIISFDPKKLSYKSLNDRKVALQIGQQFARSKYPHNQSFIAVQADNTHHILHDHVITNARRLDNDMSSTHEANFKKTVPYTDKAIKDISKKYNLNLAPLSYKHLNNHYFSNNIKIRKMHCNHNYSYVADIANRIYQSEKHSTSGNQFISQLHKRGVNVRTPEKMQKNKKTHQYQYHIYTHTTPKNTYEKITPSLIHARMKTAPKIVKNSHLNKHIGEYLRIKSHLTYTFNDNTGRSYVVRDKKLGKFASINGIETNLNRNRKRQQEVKINRQLISLRQLKPTYYNEKIYKFNLGSSHEHIGNIYHPKLNTQPIARTFIIFNPKNKHIKHTLSNVILRANSLAQRNARLSQRQQLRHLNEYAYQQGFKEDVAKETEKDIQNKAMFKAIKIHNQENQEAYQQKISDFKSAQEQLHQGFTFN